MSELRQKILAEFKKELLGLDGGLQRALSGLSPEISFGEVENVNPLVDCLKNTLQPYDLEALSLYTHSQLNPLFFGLSRCNLDKIYTRFEEKACDSFKAHAIPEFDRRLASTEEKNRFYESGKAFFEDVLSVFVRRAYEILKSVQEHNPEPAEIYEAEIDYDPVSQTLEFNLSFGFNLKEERRKSLDNMHKEERRKSSDNMHLQILTLYHQTYGSLARHLQSELVHTLKDKETSFRDPKISLSQKTVSELYKLLNKQGINLFVTDYTPQELGEK